MKGLLIHEFKRTKSIIRNSVLLSIILIGIGAWIENIYYMTLMVFISVLLPIISTIDNREINTWDQFTLSMPISRKDMIDSKYIFSGIIIIITSIVSLLSSYFLIYLKTDINMLDYILANYIPLFLLVVIVSLYFPLAYNFGLPIANFFIVSFAVLFALFMMNFVLFKSDISNILSIFNSKGLAISLVIFIGIISISYFLSLRVYLKKDF